MRFTLLLGRLFIWQQTVKRYVTRMGQKREAKKFLKTNQEIKKSDDTQTDLTQICRE
jgi:hypothetical protein